MGLEKIISGKHTGATGTVDSKVFQYSVDYPEELGSAYHVVLDTGDGGYGAGGAGGLRWVLSQQSLQPGPQHLILFKLLITLLFTATRGL